MYECSSIGLLERKFYIPLPISELFIKRYKFIELLDYELFSVFLFHQAPIPLLVIALLFAILSGIVQRPYCRFVCPTGSLIKFSQQSK